MLTPPGSSADQISARLSGRPHPDSAALVREVRDR